MACQMREGAWKEEMKSVENMPALEASFLEVARSSFHCLENLSHVVPSLITPTNRQQAKPKRGDYARNHATEDGGRSEYPSNSTVIEKLC